jgi:hypothetical protein
MTKKQTAPEAAVDAPIETSPLVNIAAPVIDADWNRRSAVEYALQHHKINGGMLTVPQLIENAKQFHAYITGESK